jgi:hypothetical protein
VDLYRRSVKRRQVYVRDCMTSGLRDVDQTGSIPVPLPPKRPALPVKPRNAKQALLDAPLLTDGVVKVTKVLGPDDRKRLLKGRTVTT